MKEAAALEAINTVLWKEWDPIGGVPEDEYRNYCSGIFRLLKANSDRFRLANHLQEVAAKSMSCSISREHAERVADSLLALEV